MGNDNESPFRGGTIEFSFPNRSRPTFLAGETVSGQVVVNLTGELFPVKNLTLGLYGHEFVHFVDGPLDENGGEERSFQYTTEAQKHKRGKFDIIRL